MTLTERFEDAQQRVNGLPQRPDNAVLLKLYGLYKQATAGDVSGDRPGAFDFKGRAKYEAWAERRGTSSEAAMTGYIALVDSLTASRP